MSTSSSASENEIKSESDTKPQNGDKSGGAGDDAQEPADKRAKVISKKTESERRPSLVYSNSPEAIHDIMEAGGNGAWLSPDDDDGDEVEGLGVGSLVWGRMCGYPYWPSFVTRSADGKFTRVVGKRSETHVQFFNWNNESGWVNKVLPWCDLDAFKRMAARAPKSEAKDFAPPSSKTTEKKWLGAVAQAQKTAGLDRRQRLAKFVVSPQKKSPSKKKLKPKNADEIETSALRRNEVNKKANGIPRAKKPSRDNKKAATIKEKPCPKSRKRHIPSERNWPEIVDDEDETENGRGLLCESDLPEGWSVAKDEFRGPDGSTFRSYEDIVRHLFDQNAAATVHPRRRAASVCDGAAITDCNNRGWLLAEADRRRHPLRSLTRRLLPIDPGALDGRVELFADPALPDRWIVKKVYPQPPGVAELVFSSPKEVNYSSKLEVAELLEPRGHPAVELEHLVHRIAQRRTAFSLFVDVRSIPDETLLHPVLGRALVPTYVDMTHLPEVFLQHECVRVIDNGNETIFTDAATGDFIAKKIMCD
jgi:hypothetical protein